MGSGMKKSAAQASREALALADAKRRARLAANERDHQERLRRSLLIAGHELGHVKPTAETEAKLRPDPIVRLVANETLTREQGRAALEIRMIHERLAAELRARVSNPELRGPRGFFGVNEFIALLHAERYLPWVRHLAGRGATEEPEAGPLKGLPVKPARAGRCPEALDIAIEVAVDHRSLRECDAARHWRNGISAKLLAYALAVYADFAGWERGRDAIAAFEAWWEKRGGKRG
jgi:hypothetical protein